MHPKEALDPDAGSVHPKEATLDRSLYPSSLTSSVHECTYALYTRVHERTGVHDYALNSSLHEFTLAGHEVHSSKYTRRPCGVAINTLVDLIELAGESPSLHHTGAPEGGGDRLGLG